MKKLVAIVLALIFVITLSACNNAKENKGDNSVVNSTVSQKDDDTKTDINDDVVSDTSSEENSSDEDDTVSVPENDNADGDLGENSQNSNTIEDPKPQDPCAEGHSFTEKRVESTCTVKGKIVKTCSRCGKSETTELSLKAHSRKDSYKKLSVTQHQKLSTCSVCGDVVTKNENHTFGQWTTTKNPTSTAAGEKTRKCSLCGQTETEAIPIVQPTNQRILELVNIERQKEGLSPLSYYSKGQAAADIRAKEIINTFSHTRPDGTNCFTALEGINYWSAGENIALGHRSAEQVVDAWMNSPGHRANILNENFTHLIVGYDHEAKAWVQLFLGFGS